MGVFDADWDGPPFELFGRDHLLALTLVVIVQVVLVWRFRRADAATRRSVRWAITAALWAQEVSYHVWRSASGIWTPREMLPFHLCSQAVWLGGAMLLLRSERLYSYVYYAALAGAVMALVTPDAGRYGWPHYRFVQFFASHGLILLAPVWMTFAEGFRPRPASVVTSFAVTVASGLAVLPLNRRIGANYMFTARKPDSASLLDALPPWPRYLPIVAALALAAYGALYAPWALSDALRRRRRGRGRGRS